MAKTAAQAKTEEPKDDGQEPAVEPVVEATPEPEQDTEDILAAEHLADLSPEEAAGVDLQDDELTLPKADTEPPAEPAAAADGGASEPASQDGGEPAPAAADGGEPAPEPAAEDGQRPADVIPTVPLPRLNQVVQQRNELAEQNAYLKGKVEALESTKAQPAAEPGAQTTEPTVKEQIVAIDAQRTELDRQLDRLDINEQEHRAADRKLESQRMDLMMQAVREETRAEVEKVAPAAAPPGDTAFVSERTKALEAQHPYFWTNPDTGKPYLNPDQVKWVGEAARMELANHGVVIDPQNMTDEQLLQWRAATAAASDVLGPSLIGLTIDQIKARHAAPGQQAQQPTKGQGTDKPGDQPNAADRKTALERAMAHPPDVEQVGTGSNESGYTEERIEGLAATNPALLEDLPDEVLDKLA